MAKPVWVEGIILAQQHFQQWDAYLSGQLQTNMCMQGPPAWGLIECQIDVAALSQGLLRILKLQAIFPNRLAINYHHQQSAQLTLNLQSQDDIVYIAIHENQKVDGISGYPQSKQTPAWHADYQEIADIYDQNRQQELCLASANLQLTASQPKDTSQFIPILAVRVSAQNQFIINDDFIAPVCKIQHSKALTHIAYESLQLCLHKQQYCQQNQEMGANQDILCYHSQIAVCELQSLLESAVAHPFALYQCLRKTISGYAILSQSDSNLPLVAYHHETGNLIFPQLFQQLSKLLSMQTQLEIKVKKFTSPRSYYFQSEEVAEQDFKDHDFLLRIDKQAVQENTLEQMLSRLKIAGPESIEHIVSRALSGIRLSMLSQGEMHHLQLSNQYYYYQLQQQDALWQEISSAKVFMMYIPAFFSTDVFDLLLLTREVICPIQ